MIYINGRLFQLNSLSNIGKVEEMILQQLHEAPVSYSYSSTNELLFEVNVRRNIIKSANAMNEGQAAFTTFEYARCNAEYWYLTKAGGFLLRNDVQPADAILDIFENSSQYAFDCSTACVIIFYHAVLNSIGKRPFNANFRNIYLYSWYTDPDLGVQTSYANHYLPGDVVYFNNPDFNPRTSWYRGENAVVLNEDRFFGHGFGIKTSKEMIQSLNKKRKEQSNQSAYLTSLVTSLSFKQLAQLAVSQRAQTAVKAPYLVIHHNMSSISCGQYYYYLNTMRFIR
ncbi:protein-glutamine gamma-glutamyltransferase [Bacillus tianshenii]|nr:protein-glutamine gamma-glutamyltransferase [Bacillus tianshenii]